MTMKKFSTTQTYRCCQYEFSQLVLEKGGPNAPRIVVTDEKEGFKLIGTHCPTCGSATPWATWTPDYRSY